MEHTNLSNKECLCKNNYTEETFFESFCKDDEEVKKCNSCQCLIYENGTMTCSKFN